MSETPRMLFVPPGTGDQHWQPQPANGWIEVLTSPRQSGAPEGFSAGLQELPPLGKIREHAHPAQTEIFWVVAGRALGRLDGAVRRIETGTFMVAPPHVRHGFINDGDGPFRFLWLLVPAGLEDFFIGIGRPKRPGQPDPTPYPRPAETGAIEQATVFETLDPLPAPPWDTAPIADAAVLVALRRQAGEAG
ncbi:cupin domain-containing protein [Falsiroseomonas sp. HC035]|uniref:cupin domain-containing protein n=1 Tax=Falsiroseomonas sp. HC035 TaxID=3390999 RepID=UPI003D310065